MDISLASLLEFGSWVWKNAYVQSHTKAARANIKYKLQELAQRLRVNILRPGNDLSDWGKLGLVHILCKYVVHQAPN